MSKLCDNVGDNTFSGCQAIVCLSYLIDHVSSYGHSLTTLPATTIKPSTPVQYVLDAPPQMLQGDVSDKLLSKLLISKSEGGKLTRRTGRRPIS